MTTSNLDFRRSGNGMYKGMYTDGMYMACTMACTWHVQEGMYVLCVPLFYGAFLLLLLGSINHTG